MHTTKDIAARLGVNAQTIRRWADLYRQHLTGELTGDSFAFSDDDLLLLWSVRRWRQLGYSLGDIADRLAAGQRTGDALPPVATDPGEPPRAILVPEGVHTAALAEIKRLEGERERLLIERDNALADRETLNQQIRGLEREIGELRGKLAIVEHERRPLAFWLVTLALAVSITALVILGALMLAGAG